MKKTTFKRPTLKTYVVQKLTLMIFTMVLMLSYLNVSAQQPNSFVLQIPGQNLNFLNANRTLITNAGNGGLSAGSVWRYDNLITTNGITIYGLLTVKEINGTGTALAMLDDDTPGTGLPGRFQPQITTTAAGGNVLFELEFHEVITNNRAYISEYYFTAADIDGGELIEIGGYSTYQVDATSGLTVSQLPSGRTRFAGITGDLGGITFDNTAAFIAQYKFPYSRVTFALGKNNAGTARQFSVQFGTAGGTFNNPTTVRNPVKLIYITKTADTNHFVAGTTRKYTVVLDNLGSTAENVTLTDPLPVGLSYVPNSTTISAPAASVVENVADNFNSVSYGRNNGNTLWKNEWTEIGETTNPAAGSITIATNRLNFANLPIGRGLERTANLTKAASASLSFVYTQSSANGTLDVQVSPNGLTYYSIGTVSGTATGNFNIPINPSYLTADTRIRLINSSAGAWGTKTTTVDDLVIQYTLSQAAQNKTNAVSGGTLANGVPQNIIVSGDNITLLPGVKATITYDVNVNCNAQGIITNTATAAAPGLYEDTISASHTAYVDPVNVTGSSRCNAGTVTLAASGAQGNQQYRWYAASTGGSPLGTGATFTTPSISGTTNYYVSFYNPDTGCESGRTPVTATVSSANSIAGTGVISITTGANGTAGNTATIAAPNNATNNNVAGTTAWTNLTNIVSSNNTNTSATAIAANGGTSQYLEIPFPAITIPAGNSIKGISINIERNASVANSIRDNVVQLLKSNVAVGNNKAATGTFWTTADVAAAYGDASDLWGTTWESSDFASTKLRIQAYNNANGTATANIDYVSFTIYYGAFGDDQSSVSFKITGISGATGYTWTPPTGAIITSGQGTDSILVNFNNAGQSGTYTVCATPTSSCGNGTQICRNIAVTNNANNEISGTVYNDQNGSVAPQKVDGTPVSQIGGQQLYAILALNASPYDAISSVTVAPDGTYKFSYLTNTGANAYRVFIKTTPYGDGADVPVTSDLPAGAIFNGVIDNDATNSLTGGTSTNGYLNVTAGNNTNNTNVNFGIAISNPVGNADTTSTLEDTAKTFNILTNDTPASGTLVGNTVDLDPVTAARQTTYTTVNGAWSIDDAGNITFTPAQDYFGNDSISYTVENSSTFKSNPTLITVTVDPVNDAPSFTKGADQTHLQTSSAAPYIVNGWATNISKGPSNESLQSISGFIVTNNNNAIFTVQPNISTNGQLQYTLAANASGTATVSVRVQDDGGTANGGIDISPVQTFIITVAADTDGDGITNDQDLDSDNDGILDIFECTYAVVSTNFSSTDGTVTNFSAPAADLGFIFDVYTLDNSFNLNINGVNLSSSVLEFQPDQTDNVRFLDGSRYGNGTIPQIYSMTGTAAAPLVRIIIHKNGAVSMYGSKSSGGALFPLQLYNGNAFNTVIWNQTSANSVQLTQPVVGATYITGRGQGLKNGFCDPDGDTISNQFDVDSDGDGCPDATEGSENVQYDQVHSLSLLSTDANYAYRGQIKVLADGITTGTPSQVVSYIANAYGVPELVNYTQANTSGTVGVADNTDGSSEIGQGIGDSQNASVNTCFCYKPAAVVGTILDTNHGVTSLQRAGANGSNWPMVRKGAWTALESKTKGFVLNRLTTAQISAIPAADLVEGMAVYNVTLDCLQINTTGTPSGWSCLNTQTCPTN